MGECSGCPCACCARWRGPGLLGSILPPAYRPQVYCGNYEYEASERELERLFKKYGRVEKVEFKTGAQALVTTPDTLAWLPCLTAVPT